MDDIYSNPPSVASSVASVSSSSKAKSLLKIEKTKKGQIEVKAGQKVWDKLPADIREDISTYMDMEGDHTEGSGKGDVVYNDVKEFFELKGDPTVKRMRSTIPKAVLLLFHTDQVIEGREKIRDMWVASKRPRHWPANVKFVDPNNGSKLPKEELLKVFQFLRAHFKKHGKEIHHLLGLDMHPAEQHSPAHQKVTTHVKRAVREIEHLSKKIDVHCETYSALWDLKCLLDNIHITNDKDVLRAYDTASAAQRLTLELEMTDKPMVDISAKCHAIQAHHVQEEDIRLAQPTSADVGQQYVESMESYSTVDPTPVNVMLPPKPKMEVINEDEKVFANLDTAPGFTMQTSTSAALDTTTTSPQLGYMDQSPFFEVLGEEQDILTQICKSLELDSAVDHVPEKKMKIESDVANIDLSNTMLEAISVHELGSGSSGVIDSEQQIFFQLTKNPIVLNALDQCQQAEKEQVADMNMGPNPSLQVTNLLCDKGGLQYFAQATSPGTQFLASEAPSTMIPTMVEAMEF